MRFSKLSKITAGSVVAVLAISWALHGRAAKSVTPDANVGQPTRRDLVQRVTVSGKVAARKRLDVKPSFTGYVQKIFVNIGDSVKTGDPLVTFSPSLSNSETNFPVRAAFSGKVTQVLKTEGESVADTGDQNLVLRVEDLTEMSVYASVPELDIAKIKLGQEATLKISSLVGESFKGKISEIALSARDKDRWGSSSSTEFQAKILITSKDPRLLPGMTALCDVVTNRADKVLVLGHEYIQQDSDEKDFVTLVSGEKRLVKLGLQTEEGVEVKEGLTEADKVRVIDFLNMPKLQD